MDGSNLPTHENALKIVFESLEGKGSDVLNIVVGVELICVS